LRWKSVPTLMFRDDDALIANLHLLAAR